MINIYYTFLENAFPVFYLIDNILLILTSLYRLLWIYSCLVWMCVIQETALKILVYSYYISFISFFSNKGQVWFNFTCENIWNSQTAMNRQERRNYLLNYSNRLETWPCKMSPTCSTLFISHQRSCTRRFPLRRHTRFVLEQDQSTLPWNLMEYSTIKIVTGVRVFCLVFIQKLN